MNLNLAAQSTQSWLNDPLCIAARSASAAGITVVVAAGNFGKSTDGKEVFGAIARRATILGDHGRRGQYQEHDRAQRRQP